MLCSIKELDGFTLNAQDGEVGRVREVYFDDERWGIRHLVVETGGWLSGRKVLISPHSISAIDRRGKRLDVALTCKQIEGAPDIDTDKPVARQNEASYNDYTATRPIGPAPGCGAQRRTRCSCHWRAPGSICHRSARALRAKSTRSDRPNARLLIRTCAAAPK